MSRQFISSTIAFAAGGAIVRFQSIMHGPEVSCQVVGSFESAVAYGADMLLRSVDAFFGHWRSDFDSVFHGGRGQVSRCVVLNVGIFRWKQLVAGDALILQ